jgi:Uma2 family endonuclease
MSGDAARKRTGYAWDDYVSWDDDTRWEIIGGEAFDMSPAPGVEHQRVVSELFVVLHRRFSDKKCEVLVSPVDVKLSEHDVVQPDIVIVCDRSKFQPSHIDGAPTLLVEVFSPSTEVHDRLRKMALYARSGVKEVWLASPRAATVEVYVLDGDTYRLAGAYGREEKLKSGTFPGLTVNLRQVFSAPQEGSEPVGIVREPGASYKARPAPPPRRPLALRRRTG